MVLAAGCWGVTAIAVATIHPRDCSARRTSWRPRCVPGLILTLRRPGRGQVVLGDDIAAAMAKLSPVAGQPWHICQLPLSTSIVMSDA